ncbi:MAG: flavin reductase family protein [Acholeplasmataceae bacterium]|nr:flavin reductase family protein [Acholeplasmataceae bacterium]
MAFVEFPLNKAFMLFEPGPVILVSTHDGKKNNLMTISWHMVTDFTPTLALTTGPWNHSFKAMMKKKECVLNVPTVDIIEKVISIGDCSGKDTDKFKKFELTPLPAGEVAAPLVADCLACLECKIIDYIEEPGIFLLQGVKAWIDNERKERRTFHANGDCTFVVDGETIDLHHLMEDKIPF